MLTCDGPNTAGNRRSAQSLKPRTKVAVLLAICLAHDTLLPLGFNYVLLTPPPHSILFF